jgi:hypothetical protein
MLITVPELGGNFTQVPNDLIRNKFLTAGQKETWLMVASVCWHGKSSEATIGSMSDVAKANGVAYSKFWMSLNRLRAAGGIVETDDGWDLLIPTAKPEKVEDFSVHEEVAAQPARKNTMKDKEAWELVKEGWNKEKPEQWLQLNGALKRPEFIALETHAKRLGVEREQYKSFVGQICRGAANDPWWGQREMKLSSVFGFGAIKERQFENVEKLYKLGSKTEGKVDYACDADILARYHDKGRTEKTKVIRFEAEDDFAAAEHLNSIPDSEYDESAAYIYFAPGKDRPIHWSLRNNNSTRYLFS